MSTQVENQQLESEKPNRMTRRRLKTRGKLLAATLKLVVQKGVDKTTMDDITEQADLGRRTLYYHFASKDECIIAAVADRYIQHAQAGADLVADIEDPAEVVAISAQVVPRALTLDPVTTRLSAHPKLLAAALIESIESYFRRDMDRGFDQGRFSNPIRGHMLDTMMLWSLVGMIIELVENQTDVDQTVRDYAYTYLIMLGIEGSEAKSIVDHTAAQLGQAA
ncbi:MAG: TetR/AcrR family transcriptional regulator [Pseudomonadota bacterium]